MDFASRIQQRVNIDYDTDEHGRDGRDGFIGAYLSFDEGIEKVLDKAKKVNKSKADCAVPQWLRG